MAELSIRGFPRRLSGDRRALAAVEFAIIMPVFLFFLFAILGAGLDGFYQLFLDEAVRNAARQIQIEAIGVPPTPASFVAAVCNEFGALANGCSTKLTYNVQASAISSGFTALTPVALSAAGTYPNGFFSNGVAYGNSVNILVQVAYPLPFNLGEFANQPPVSSLITETGTNSIVAAATVRGGPY